MIFFRAVAIDTTEVYNYSVRALDPNFEGAVMALRSHVTSPMHLTKENIYQYNVCYNFPKYSYLTKKFDEIIMNYLAGGFIERWQKIINDKPRTETYVQRRLNSEHFSGCFYLILIGYLIAFCVFILEQCIYSYKQRKRNKVVFLN